MVTIPEMVLQVKEKDSLRTFYQGLVTEEHENEFIAERLTTCSCLSLALLPC